MNKERYKTMADNKEKDVMKDFFEGNDIEAYKYFGSHPKDGYVEFNLYAPNAQSISVVGTFNKWDIEANPMKKGAKGIWNVQIKEAKIGDRYKYHVVQSTGEEVDKIDPYAFYSEFRPNTASIISSLSFDGWDDQDWMATRTKGYDKPISIYEMHVGSWKRKGECGVPEATEEEKELAEKDPAFFNDVFLKYKDMVDELIEHCKKYSFTHVEVMPLCEHPFDGSWGYQSTGYFSTTSRYGTNKELKEFVNKLHEAGIGVIMDFVPVHFVKDNFALAKFDGTALYEYPNPDDANSEWGTANFDLWKEEVRSFLMSAANYWLEEYHMDGLRMDAIANAIFWKGNKDRGANEGALNFMKRMNFRLNQRWDGRIMLIAEDSSDFPNVTKPTLDGGLGFDYKWDLGWMNDTLSYLKKDPIYRQWHHNDITFSMAYFYSEKFILPLSHDEVVHGKATIVDKMWGSYEDKFSQARELYTYMFTHPGKKLNFMGNEIGMLREWDEQKSVDWFLQQYPMHSAFAHYFEEIAKLTAENDAFWYGYDPLNFQWINADDASHNVFSYMRKGTKEDFIILLNFSTNPYRLQFGAPYKGIYTEVLNSQWPEFNGSMVDKNVQQVRAIRLPMNNQPYRIEVNLPALGAVIFKVEKPETADKVDPNVSKNKEADWAKQNEAK
jgi:1,4-alpha-glucan branching enzyme